MAEEIFYCGGKVCNDTMCERDHVSSLDMEIWELLKPTSWN